MRLTLHKEFLTIGELTTRWELTLADLQYIAEHGDLKVYVRPTAIDAAAAPIFPRPALEKIKQCPLCPIDIHRLFDAHDSHIAIRPPIQTARRKIEIGFADMIVRTPDIEQFEKEHAGAERDPFVLLSPDFREFMIRGEVLRMGDKQAAIAKHLHARLDTDNPWVHGKDLMKIAGSASWKIQNLFGRNKNWRAAIKSDGHGYYKFNL